MKGGLLVQRRHGPTPRCEVSGFDNSEGGHPHAHVWARGLWVLGREPWMSIHLSKPMLGKSPRSTANTCPSQPTAPSLIVSRASSHQESSLQVRDRFKNSPILSQKAKAKLEASSLNSSSVIEPGELLRRSDQAFQPNRGG